MELLPLKNSTRLPYSALPALPVMVGVVSLVVVDVVVIDGALGAVVSTVMDKADEESDMFPAASVAVVVRE